MARSLIPTLAIEASMVTGFRGMVARNYIFKISVTVLPSPMKLSFYLSGNLMHVGAATFPFYWIP